MRASTILNKRRFCPAVTQGHFMPETTNILGGNEMKITRTITIEKSTRHPNYTPEERLAAIELAKEIGAKSAGDQLGVNHLNIYAWKSQMKREEKRRNELSALHNEIARQREEIRALKASLKSAPKRKSIALTLPYVKEETITLS